MEKLQGTVEEKVKKLIVDKLGLDVSPEEIDDDAPLFDIDDDGNGLDLDSVDALELVVGIKQQFDIKLDNADLTIFYSVKSIADTIRRILGECE
ncbi:acyl carrier protein [Paenibacillus alvei]|uniref:acyl carrier protein n=1 Tax=Paenibacillus alvei TaxID=44250 RepID=UPI00038603E5|nr:phosphopantetheine-binding protein [Paenibacillus alvei]EPY14035.1 acyl carrier protein [Paenibacillus alvei A6-6i-x]